MRVSAWLVDATTNTVIGTSTVGGKQAIQVDVVKTVGGGGPGGSGILTGSQQNTFITTGAGTAIDGSSSSQWKYYSLSVKQTGVVTSWSVDIEISNDNVTYTVLSTHTKASNGNGKILCITAPALADYVRVNVTALTLGAGTNIITELRSSQ